MWNLHNLVLTLVHNLGPSVEEGRGELGSGDGQRKGRKVKGMGRGEYCLWYCLRGMVL